MAFVEPMSRSPIFPLLPHYPEQDEIQLFGQKIKPILIAGAGYTQQTAEQVLQDGMADLVAFGVAFLANSDLPQRFEKGVELNVLDRATMFGSDAKGCTDYPFMG